jgi:trigger factor
MEYTVEAPEPWKRVIEVRVPAAKITQEIDQLSDYYGKRTKLNGFRAGRVPAQVVKAKHFAKLQEEAMERVVEEAYREALQQTKLSPVNTAKISDVDFNPKGKLSFRASFEIVPDIEIKQYKNLPAARRVREIGQMDVDRELENLRLSVPILKPVERKIAEDDAVVLDVETYQGRKLMNRTAESTMFVRNMSEEVQKNIIGKRAGDIVSFENQGTLTHIFIKNVKEPVYPELSDSFAKDLGYENLDALRNKLKEELEKGEKRRSEREVEEQLIRHLIDENPFEPPSSLVELHLDSVSRTPEERRKHRSQAIYLVKREIILDKIAHLENISIAQKELHTEIVKIAKSRDVSPERLEKQLQKSDRIETLREQIKHTKVLKFLVSQASIKIEKAKE